MLNPSKKLARRIFLRGAVLEKWVARQARRLDRAYCSELMSSTAPQTTPSAPAIIVPSASLRQILFIADCMWELNDLVPELKKIANVEVLNLRPGLQNKASSQNDAEIVAAEIQKFSEKEKNLSPDLILFYARSSLLSDEVFEHLRKRWRVPVWGMNLDDKTQFFDHNIYSEGEDNYQHWAKKFDLNLTGTLAATQWYRQRGLACTYCPSGFHQSEKSSPPTSCDYRYPMSFIGSARPEREIIISQLVAAGVPINLFGSGWPQSEWVSNPQEIYRSSQFNLGIGIASPSLTLTSVKGRDFECPGAGACYLTTYNWELAHHFEIGKEILCYRSVEELIEIFSFYKKRPEECLKIAQAAWQRCSEEHTWEKRFRKIFTEAGFKL